jgi:hypothetical protein
MDAIINAGPSRRAQKAANEMAEFITVDGLNESLAAQLRLQTAATTDAPQGVVYSEVRSVQPITSRGHTDDAIEISTYYLLSEDSSTLRVTASVQYQNPQTPYTTPYQFKGSPPKAAQGGPAYRNTFTYYSAQLPVPTLTPELRERLIASIQDSARDDNGALPAEGTTEFKSMQKELENARDERLTKDEIAIFLTREWLKEDGAMLRQEIEHAHEFIARYALIDMNRPIAPSLTGQDELIETMTDARTVRRIGAGTSAGSYISSAANVSSFSTYGNAMAMARANRERASSIKEQAQAASSGRTGAQKRGSQ